MTRTFFKSSRVPFVTLLFALTTGCGSLGPVGEFGQRLRDKFSGHTPLEAAKRMEDPQFADERRIGMNDLAARPYGLKTPYTDRYQQIAQLDSDWLVRATAIRSLNRARDQSATPLFIKALADSNELVRVEAAKALSNIPDENAAPVLIRIVTNANESRDVRIWSAAALRHYHTLDAARALTGQLTGREFAIAWQSRRSLRTLTSKDLGYDERAWLDYLTGPEKPFG